MLVALPAAVSAADDAAHRLADKFATGDRAAREAADAELRAAEEAEMLERARREAAERTEVDRAAEAAAEARMKEMEAAREAEAKRLAEKLRRAEDARRQRAASETQSTGAFKPALKPASPPVANVSPPAIAREPGPEITRDLEPAGAPLVHEPAAQTAATPVPSSPLSSPPMSLGRHEPELAGPADRRVTVLLVMQPGKKGIRRFNKTADPVLCHDTLCFVSKGAGAPARVMTRRKALGAGNTLGKRAGACRHSLTCAYRGVTLDGPAPVIEPVDLKILVHDRREPRAVSGDASCHVTAGRLSCGRTVVAAGYRAWIVPESVAEQAGPAGLAAALSRGLQPVDLREAAFRD